jgi:hypothetical protein
MISLLLPFTIASLSLPETVTLSCEVYRLQVNRTLSFPLSTNLRRPWSGKICFEKAVVSIVWARRVIPALCPTKLQRRQYV